MALRAGSLVVNSSQGGGSKDTWVLEARKWSSGVMEYWSNAEMNICPSRLLHYSITPLFRFSHA